MKVALYRTRRVSRVPLRSSRLNSIFPVLTLWLFSWVYSQRILYGGVLSGEKGGGEREEWWTKGWEVRKGGVKKGKKQVHVCLKKTVCVCKGQRERERQRQTEKETECVCVRVWEREGKGKKRETEREREMKKEREAVTQCMYIHPCAWIMSYYITTHPDSWSSRAHWTRWGSACRTRVTPLPSVRLKGWMRCMYG